MKREFVGYLKSTGEKVYKVDMGMLSTYQTEAGRVVSANDVEKK